MRYKTFDKPHSHDAEWYMSRESADHINQSNHRPRLLKALNMLIELVGENKDYTICDFGCGNGGLIRTIEQHLKNKIWGYDLCPANVNDSILKGSKNIFYKDFIIQNDLDYPDIAICTEVLEHLVDPDTFLKKLLNNNVKYIIASSPDYETPTHYEPYHLWVFNGNSYREMFESIGFHVLKHERIGFQFILAKK